MKMNSITFDLVGTNPQVQEIASRIFIVRNVVCIYEPDRGLVVVGCRKQFSRYAELHIFLGTPDNTPRGASIRMPKKLADFTYDVARFLKHHAHVTIEWNQQYWFYHLFRLYNPQRDTGACYARPGNFADTTGWHEAAMTRMYRRYQQTKQQERIVS